MKLSVRPCPLAGLGIRSQAVPRAALIRTHHTHSFLPRSDVLTQTYTREARSSHIRPANPPSLRPFSTTAANLQNKLDEMAAEPTGLIADSGIELLTWGTPNGVKASILLEELKEAYGKSYTFQAINISKNTQKEPWYTALSPNGRIPTIVDHDRNGFAVFETLAILTYLARHYDPEHKFSFPADSDDYSVAEQWLAWGQGGLGPMQGQANHFLRAAKEKIPYGIQRYVGEAERLYGVLDARLADRDYVAGPGRGKYSIADISLVGWTNISNFSGVDLAGLFPNVNAWLNRLLARPAVQKGLAVPSGSAPRLSNANLAKAVSGESDWEEGKKMAEGGFQQVAEAKEKYGYKYASP